MAEQLWKGRFSKAVDSRVNDFNSSIRFDQRMIAQDMRGSGVHAAMLAKQGIISEKDCEDILNGLASIADDLAAGRLEIDPNAEDVHTFVEQTLTARIGDAGKRLHTGRSRRPCHGFSRRTAPGRISRIRPASRQNTHFLPGTVSVTTVHRLTGISTASTERELPFFRQTQKLTIITRPKPSASRASSTGPAFSPNTFRVPQP